VLFSAGEAVAPRVLTRATLAGAPRPQREPWNRRESACAQMFQINETTYVRALTRKVVQAAVVKFCVHV